MRVMQINIGVIKDGFKETKKIWKLRKEEPQLFLFLTHLTYLGIKFRKIIEGKYVFTEEDLINAEKRVDDFLFTLKSDMRGEVRYSKPKEVEG